MNIEITPEMIEAGEAVLSRNYLSLVDGDKYRQIVRTVFEVMAALALPSHLRIDPPTDQWRAEEEIETAAMRIIQAC